jgi:hypothetical protein
MEFRDSGRDLVQIKDDGTHVILPATPHPMVRPDRAGLPVMMMLRHADGKMRRDAIHAARMQRCCTVAERRLHGAPGLADVDELHVLARIRWPCRSNGESRQWVRKRKTPDRLRRLF